MSLKHWVALHIPTPRYISMAHVGVDISPTCIHIAEIKRHSTHLELGKYGKQELPQPVNYNEPLSADTDLLAALKKMQRQFHLDFVEVSIPEEHAYIFTMDLPAGDEQTIRNHIELHLEENVPLSLEDSVYDYHVIEKLFDNAPAKVDPTVVRSKAEVKKASSSETEVEVSTEGDASAHIPEAAETPEASRATAVASTTETEDAKAPVALPGSSGLEQQGPTFFASISVVSRTLIDQYIELFETAGMMPVSFLIENQALSKSIIKAGDLDTKLIVHVGDRKSVLSVVSKGSVHFTSTVNIGSDDFTAAIMKEFNVSREEALRMKIEKGTARGPDDNQSSLFMSLINTASALKDEIDHIILYWQSYVGKRGRASNDSIKSLVLSGHDALINGFREYLIATVRLPVETANVWSNIYDLDKKIPHIDYIDSLDYAIAIGLALPKLDH